MSMRSRKKSPKNASFESYGKVKMAKKTFTKNFNNIYYFASVAKKRQKVKKQKFVFKKFRRRRRRRRRRVVVFLKRLRLKKVKPKNVSK